MTRLGDLYCTYIAIPVRVMINIASTNKWIQNGVGVSRYSFIVGDLVPFQIVRMSAIIMSRNLKSISYAASNRHRNKGKIINKSM